MFIKNTLFTMQVVNIHFLNNCTYLSLTRKEYSISRKQ